MLCTRSQFVGSKVEPAVLSLLPQLFRINPSLLSHRLRRNKINHHLFIATPVKMKHLSAANLSHE